MKSDLLPHLEETNHMLAEMKAEDRLKWVSKKFENIYAMTSAGIDSALLLDLIKKSHLKFPVVHVDTGFLHPETTEFKDLLTKWYGLEMHEFSPTQTVLKKVINEKLWEKDIPKYSHLTKVEPLSKAIKSLKVEVLISGVRSDQTKNRTNLKFIGVGSDGEVRFHPILDWSQQKVDKYIEDNKLPRNQLYYQGFGSIGDIFLTSAGKKREGREVMECGIHVDSGIAIKKS